MESHILTKIIRDTDECENNSTYNGYLHLRILSIFMILLSSGIGIFLPILLGGDFLTTKIFKNQKESYFLKVFYFICKNFGQGVIFATGFIHLLQPANEALTSSCLGGAFQEYPFAFALCMLSIFSIYLIEIITRHYIEKLVTNGKAEHQHGHGLFNIGEILEDEHLKEHGILTNNNHNHNACHSTDSTDNRPRVTDDLEDEAQIDSYELTNNAKKEFADDLESGSAENSSQQLSVDTVVRNKHDHHSLESMNQIMSVCILEFGVIFHSVFIGLTLGVVSGNQFKILFIVLVIHQGLEGLGCGARISESELSNRIKYIFGAMYTCSTPIAVAIGLGVRTKLSMDSVGVNVASGVFDSISAGILMYNAFSLLFGAFNEYPGDLKMKLLAYVTTCFGVGIMALLGKWA